MDLVFISDALSLHLITPGVGDKVLALGMAAGMESARSSQGCSAMYPLQDTAELTSGAGGASVQAQFRKGKNVRKNTGNSKVREK